VILLTFGNRLKSLLDERQVTQKQLAQDLNIASTTVNGYVQDYREPDFATLDLLASYFSVSADYLIGHAGYESKNKQLNANESEIITLFRILTDEQQDYLIGQAKLYIRCNSRKEKQISSDITLKSEA